MKLSEWLKKWDMSSLKINLKLLEMEWSPKENDRNAAWELYIELLTRISTQYLEPEMGDEATAVESIHKLFDLTRCIIRNYGRDCLEFTKIAVVVLNQIIRPFTTKWHRELLAGSFDDVERCELFRKELRHIQQDLRKYTKMLADMADVEDLTVFEAEQLDY